MENDVNSLMTGLVCAYDSLHHGNMHLGLHVTFRLDFWWSSFAQAWVYDQKPGSEKKDQASDLLNPTRYHS